MARLLNVLTLLALAAPAAAFAPVRSSTLPALRTASQSRGTVAAASRAPTRTATTTMVLPEVLKWVAAGPVMYGLMSVNEYVTHRYYQHTDFNKSGPLQAIAALIYGGKDKVPRVLGGGHVEHHAETLDNMMLRTDQRWRESAPAKKLDSDPYRGTAFTWQVSGLMLLQMLPTTLPVYHLMGFSLPTTFAILLPAMAIHALIWNALHPNMHGLPDVPLSVGFPSSVFAGLRNTPYFRYLYVNHEGHHVAGGQANYNVCCPGTDFVVGSFCPEAVWRPKAKLPVPEPELSVSS